jgi:hypothetical protein
MVCSTTAGTSIEEEEEEESNCCWVAGYILIGMAFLKVN